MEQHAHNTTTPTVVVASRYGTLWTLDARDGSILWRLTPTGRDPTLIHAGDILYVSSHIPLAAFKVLDDASPLFPAGHSTPIHAYPAELVALRIDDGTPIWQRDGWRATSNAIALDGDTLLSEGPVQNIGDVHIHALDAHTGAIRWTYDAGHPFGFQRRILAARANLVFVWHEVDRAVRRLDVLDSQTGDLLWSKETTPPMAVSEHGSLIALSPFQPPEDGRLPIYATHDGTQTATLPGPSLPLALSDDGIAYLSGYAPPPPKSSAQKVSGQHATPPKRHTPVPTISAVRIGDGSELWRTEGIETAGHPVVTAHVLYSAHLTQPQERGEVTALDIHTGQLLWRWRTPGNIISLLRLWGRRTPQVLIYALAQARRSIIRAREHHDWSIVRREVIKGQWRRPTHLITYIGVHLAAHADAVYLTTSLGLFALHPRDGHLLWHALPTSELVQVVASPSPA